MVCTPKKTCRLADTALIPSPAVPSRRIEFFFCQPTDEGPWPALIHVHGHQFPDRPGGRRLADSGYLDQVAADGVLAIAVSQPGYGGSDGPPDYCGPETQRAILAVIGHAIDHLHATPGRIALVGGSRGAIASAVAATDTDRVNALVLSAGFYDFAAGYRDCPVPGIRRNIEAEAGTTAQAFDERSALTKAHRIACPVLIMHGGRDEQFAPAQAEQFAHALAQNGVPVELCIFADEPHVISPGLFFSTTHDFINRHLGTVLPTG